MTRTEIACGKNGDHHRLALVRVSPDGPEADEARYVGNAFDGLDIADGFALHSVVLDWSKFWSRAALPY